MCTIVDVRGSEYRSSYKTDPNEARAKNDALFMEMKFLENLSLDLIHWLSLNVSLNVFKGKIFMKRISRCYGRIKIVWSIAFENIAKYRSRNFARALTKLKCALLLVSLFGNWKLAIIKGVYICFFRVRQISYQNKNGIRYRDESEYLVNEFAF